MSGSVSVFNLNFYRPRFHLLFYRPRFQFTILASQISIYIFTVRGFNLQFWRPGFQFTFLPSWIQFTYLSTEIQFTWLFYRPRFQFTFLTISDFNLHFETYESETVNCNSDHMFPLFSMENTQKFRRFAAKSPRIWSFQDFFVFSSLKFQFFSKMFFWNMNIMFSFFLHSIEK